MVSERAAGDDSVEIDFIGHATTRLVSGGLAILTDPERREAIKRGLAEVRTRLGTPGASARAARAVLEVARLRAARFGEAGSVGGGSFPL